VSVTTLEPILCAPRFTPHARLSTRQRRRAIYEDALAVIEAHYGGDLGVDALARAVLVSSRQLQRAFAEEGNTTVRRAVYEVRMRRAAELLADGASAKAAGLGVGYRSAAQFSRAFTRHFGQTPTSYRRNRDGVASPASSTRPRTQ
jgi:AraC-like DNA-binding protein